MSDELVSKVDSYAKKMGVSRSALCAMFIGQGVMTFDKSFDIMTSLSEKLGDNLLAERTLKNMGNDLLK